MSRITSVAVLGAGTMGAQIAAHFANAGVPALLLDLDARVAREGFERARKLKPDPLFGADVATLVSFGGFDTDLARVAGADWIIEAVVERLDVKQALLARVDEVRRPGTFVSSNTSGISIREIAEGRTADFRAHWLGTHFFNPPRYLHLLEVIPTSDTDPVVVESICTFADHRLGKGVVLAKDTPNFIANHIGAARRGAHARRARARRVHDRRDGRDHRARGGPAEERDVQDAGHRRPRRARARHQEPARPAACRGS